jgi:2-aminoadipate transaminase
MSEERRQRLAELAVEHDLLVLEDDAYGLLGFDGRDRDVAAHARPRARHLPRHDVEDVLAGRAFRLDRRAHPGAREARAAARGRGPVPEQPDPAHHRALADDAAVAGAGQALPRALPAEGRADARALAAEMPVEVDWTRPRGGFFVWLTVPTGIDTSALLAKAIGRRVAYVPGRGFYDDGSGGDQLRLCFSFPPSDRIREGVSRLAELLHDELGLLRAVYGEGAPELAGRRGRGGDVHERDHAREAARRVAVLSGRHVARA